MVGDRRKIIDIAPAATVDDYEGSAEYKAACVAHNKATRVYTAASNAFGLCDIGYDEFDAAQAEYNQATEVWELMYERECSSVD